MFLLKKCMIKAGMVLFLMVLPLCFFAQNKAGLSASSASEMLMELRKGTLIVRIYMNKNKTDVLQKAIQEPGIGDEKKKSLQKMLKEHVNDREAYKKQVIESFKNNYNFSKILFIHDYDQKKFTSGEASGVFLNEQGIPDPKIQLETLFYLLCGRGNNDETFIIFDKNGASMPANFPDRYNRNIFQGLASLFIKDKMSDYIKKINQQLKDKYNEWIWE